MVAVGIFSVAAYTRLSYMRKIQSQSSPIFSQYRAQYLHAKTFWSPASAIDDTYDYFVVAGSTRSPSAGSGRLAEVEDSAASSEDGPNKRSKAGGVVIRER